MVSSNRLLLQLFILQQLLLLELLLLLLLLILKLVLVSMLLYMLVLLLGVGQVVVVEMGISILEMPKSDILTFPRASNKILSGFISLCRMPDLS